METKEIAQKLVEYCRKADWDGAHKELYAKNATSIEPYETPDFPKTTKGLDAIVAKGKKFDSMVEQMHKLTVSDPLVVGNSIAFVMEMDLTMNGQRMGMPEICVYTVKDGKIVTEEFFV